MKNVWLKYGADGLTVLLTVLSLTGCGTTTSASRTNQYIHVENQNRAQIRAYVALESTPEVRVLLGTVDSWDSEDFLLPKVFQSHQGLIVTCEVGRSNNFNLPREYFRTSYVALPAHATLIVTVRDPIRYSDYKVSGDE